MLEVLDLVRKDFGPAYIVYNDEFGSYVRMDSDIVKEKFDRFMKIHASVWSEQQQIKTRFVYLGTLLAELRQSELYKVVCQEAHGGTGYSNFYTFCGDVFGFKKSTVANLLKVYEEFCNKENGLLDVQYMNFSYTQLVELSSMENYRERIPVTMSRRNIQRLKELYKEYTPKPGNTVEDDLKEWQRRHEEKKDKANAEKNAINFVPAKKSDKAVGNSDVQPVGHEELAESDSEDERDLSTPDVPVQLTFEEISKGLLRQLDLLGKIPGWQRVANIVTEAIVKNNSRNVAARSEVVEQIHLNGDYLKKVEALRAELKRYKNTKESEVRPAFGDKLNLKNEKARKEWLDNFRSWGVWLAVPEVDKTFYRYNFVNGFALIVEVGMQYPDSWSTRKDPYEFVRYSMIDDEHKKFNSWGDSYTAVIQWLSKYAKVI